MLSDSNSLPSEPLARIFLLSHMRAYTSLAGHVLGSHPQINGYYEMHLGYEFPAALDRQLDAYLESDVIKSGSRYLFDKLLHNDYVLKPEQLGMVECKILISLAQPERTIQSIAHLYADRNEVEHEYASPEGAARYYIDRLKALADYSREYRQSCFYFDAELWQRAPERLLPKLSQWLELDSPLSERYQIFSQTGKPLKGDSSPRIQGGCIDRSASDYSHVVAPEAVLDEARAVYEECRGKILNNARDSSLNGG
jgi:hypothetical protein